MEKDSEEEGIIPTNWIKENNVYWPTVADASKALKERSRAVNGYVTDSVSVVVGGWIHSQSDVIVAVRWSSAASVLRL